MAPVSAANGSPHPFLRVVFDTRVYNDGTARVDVTVENVLDLVGATTVTYNVTLTVNGNAFFTKTAVEHYYLTRWRKTFTVGGPLGDITPDLAPFNAANAIPPYLSIVRNQINTPTGATYEILREGALEKNMPAHSGRQEIAPYPDWTARYLVHKNSTQRAFVLANGDLSGSWPIHMREREAGPRLGVGPDRFISFDERPNFWLDDRAAAAGWDTMAGTPLPMHEYGNIIPGPGQTALIPDVAHQPSLAFVPYLLTGDRYYADEMAFWAFYCMGRTYPGDGTRSNTGIVANNETRGFGWALRNMADAAAYYPEASPVRAYLVQKVQNNLNWIDSYASARFTPSNPFKVLWTGLRPEGPQFISLWEQTYLGIAIDRANQHGFVGGLGARDAIAGLQLKLFASEPDYPRVSNLGCSVGVISCPWSAPYLVNVGVPVPAPGTGLTFYQTIGEIAANTVGNPDLQRDYAGFYGPEARLNLMRAIQTGAPGAQAAYDYLFPFIGTAPAFCASDGASIPDLACRAGWAVDFATGTAPPPPPPPSTQAAQLLTPASGATFGSSVQSFSWSAGTGVTSYKISVGSTPGSSNFYAGAETLAQSAVVGGLPVNGSQVFVRLSSKISGVFQFSDYSFTSYTAPVIAPPPAPLAAGAVIFADGNSTVQTAPFNTAAGDLLVAFVSSSGPQGAPETMTVAGGSLAWTLAARANAQNGVSEIWWATTPTAQTGMTVTSTHTSSTTDQSLVVAIFSGAGGIGAKNVASAASGAPSVSLTTTRAGSFVYAVGNDWDGAVSRTLGPNQTSIHEVLGGNGDTFWVQRLTAPTSAAGVVVTMNDTAPTIHSWNFAAVEIVPASAAAKTVPTITWATPADIVKGTALSATQLNATASVPGTFVYAPAAGTVLNAGNGQALSVTFNPTDTATYQSATAAVLLNVLPSAPTVTWNAPAPIVAGVALSATQLNATADFPGTYVYSPVAGTVLAVGQRTLQVTFTPTNTAFAPIVKTVPLAVLKRTPVITWNTPANITPGATLSATQLNATADVTGNVRLLARVGDRAAGGVRTEADRDVHADRHGQRRVCDGLRHHQCRCGERRRHAGAGEDRHDDLRQLRRRDRTLESVTPGVCAERRRVVALHAVIGARCVRRSDGAGVSEQRSRSRNGDVDGGLVKPEHADGRRGDQRAARRRPLTRRGIADHRYDRLRSRLRLRGARRPGVVERPHPCATRADLDHLAGPVEQSGLAQHRVGIQRPARHGRQRARDQHVVGQFGRHLDGRLHPSLQRDDGSGSRLLRGPVDERRYRFDVDECLRQQRQPDGRKRHVAAVDDRRHRQDDGEPVQGAGVCAARLGRDAGRLQQRRGGAAAVDQPALPEVGRERHVDQHLRVHWRRRRQCVRLDRDDQSERLDAGAGHDDDRLRVPSQGQRHGS